MPVSLAERLRVLRAQQGLSLTEASEKIRVNRHTLRDLELGKREPYGPTIRKIAEGYGVPVAQLFEEPALPLDDAPTRGAGRPSAIDVAKDAARRQTALEKQAMFGGQSEPMPMLEQRHANEAMRRLREEYGLEGNDAEAVVDFVLKAARLEEENATLRDRLQEREQAHS
jgi:transcriptional regulator with XRE-family HTH domain